MKTPYFSEQNEQTREAFQQFIQTRFRNATSDLANRNLIPKAIWKLLLEFNTSVKNNPDDDNLFQTVVAIEELSRLNLSGFSTAYWANTKVAVNYLERFGSRFIKRNYLSPLLSADKTAGIGIVPSFTKDLDQNVSAQPEGNFFRLNGKTSFIVNGGHADFWIIAAKTVKERSNDELNIFVVDRDLPGLTVKQMDVKAWRTTDFAEILFDNVKIASTQLIGQEKMGFYYQNESLQLERLLLTISALAFADNTLQYTLNVLSIKKPDHLQNSIIRENIAKLDAEIMLGKQMAYQAAWLMQEGFQFIKAASIAKVQADKTVIDTISQSIEWLGLGEAQNYQFHSQLLLDAQMFRFFGGSSFQLNEAMANLVIEGKGYLKFVKALPPSNGESLDEKYRNKSSAEYVVIAKQKPIETSEIHIDDLLNSDNGISELEIDVSEIADKNTTSEENEVDEDALENTEVDSKELKKLEELDALLDDVELDENLEPDENLLLAATQTAFEKEAELTGKLPKTVDKNTEIIDEEIPKAVEIKPAGLPQVVKQGLMSRSSLQQKIKTPEIPIKKLMNSLPERFIENEHSNNFTATYHFKISGNDSGNYTVNIANNACKVKNKISGKPTCIIESSDRYLIEMETGLLNPQIAFMMGKVKFSNVPQMMRYIKIFDKYDFSEA